MIKVEVLPSRTLVGLSRPFISAARENSNAQQVIGPLWAEMSKVFFGLKLDRADYPVGVGAMWPTSDFESTGSMVYFAGYEVNEAPKDLGGLEILNLDEATYAVAEHLGEMSQLPAFIVNFYTKLLPESGLERRDGIDLEIYVESADSSQPMKAAIAAPIK